LEKINYKPPNRKGSVHVVISSGKKRIQKKTISTSAVKDESALAKAEKSSEGLYIHNTLSPESPKQEVP
jgi:hypothetical protein